jgi:DNA-binding beta-propeller fold protein YncE
VAPDGRVYAADEGGHRVEVFDAQGRFIKQLGTFGTAVGRFDRPTRVDIGADGSLYVKDGTAITRFAPDGNVDWRVGGPEAVDPRLRRETYDIAVMADGRLLVTLDSGGPGLLLNPANGAIIGEWGPEDIGESGEPAVNPDGTVWLFTYGVSRIDVLSAGGSRLARYTPPSGSDAAVIYPTPVAAPNGHAYSFMRDLGLVELAYTPTK